MTGRLGTIGKPGKNEPTGVKRPQQPHDVLDMIVLHFEDVYQQLNEHMRLIATMQQQVRGLIASDRRLSK